MKRTRVLAIASSLGFLPAAPVPALPYAQALAGAGTVGDVEQTTRYAHALASDGTATAIAEISLELGLLRGYTTSSLAPSPGGTAGAVAGGWDLSPRHSSSGSAT